ncbi:hypothetical protein FQR65_LT16498 [Abscondita terminalis]|nr:hypothetical protein FQR65_LT16498 [Abscondita terminalis]
MPLLKIIPYINRRFLDKKVAKVKTAYYCQNCGTQYPQWHGQCKNCGEWNTLVEEVIEKSTSKNYSGEKKQHIINIIEVNAQEEPRIATPSDELNRVLGGGIVLGSVTLIGGEPDRLTDLQNPECFLFTETSVDKILHEAKKLQPQFMILDSIQTLHSGLIESSPGTVSQIRECSSEIIKFAKETNTPVFLVGHITKDGQIAGPKVLEHMVDVVLNFDGDRNHLFRLLRANKNRFGSTSEIGIYEMISQGLKEIKNPSEILITKKFEELSGNSVAVTLEGNRPMLLEIQALNLVMDLLFLFIVYSTFYHVLRQREIYPVSKIQLEDLLSIESEEKTEKKKLIPDEEFYNLKEKLLTLMNGEKPYLEGDLNLLKLSELIGISRQSAPPISEQMGFNENFFSVLIQLQGSNAKELYIYSY